MAKIKKEVLKELDSIFEKHKKKYPNRKMTEKELDKLLDSELKPEFVRKMLNIEKKGKFTKYNNIKEFRKEVEKLEEQNEFLESFIRSLEDAKAGRIKEVKFK